MSKNDKPRVLKVWCGRRDQAHRKQKREVRTPLVYIEPVETGKPKVKVIPNNVAIPSVCKKVSVRVETLARQLSAGGDIPVKPGALFDWEKGRRLWTTSGTLKSQPKWRIKAGQAVDSEASKHVALADAMAHRQRKNAHSSEPYPGHLRVTCPVCGTIYRLTLYGEVAEWLDNQLGKTGYVSAKHLEKLSLEMMGKHSQ
ncbi:hypothetical protein [Varibaculum cambriense]|uniref:hypothetical protein n=1 Tax=Varibaculum cambriense TaxID=184870 RepID=UPI0025867CB5|nr:hypothetical protein [Varibaculum cambriense]MDU1224786.1 hypothetical protein [Varibaculum cambriense]